MASIPKSQTLPSLPGISQEAADQIRQVVATNRRLQARIEALEKAGFITAKQADQQYSPYVMAKALSANGVAPLNVVMVSGTPIIQAQPTGRRTK